jgi:glucose-6-phosphate 1-dehydrogenase
MKGSSPADVLVIFGITGNLARKMTFRALYRLERRRLLDCPVIGVARAEWSAAALRDHARRAIEEAGEAIDEDVFRRFAGRLSMITGEYGEAQTYDRLARAIAAFHTPVFYLETPPSLFGGVVEGLARAGLTGRARVVLEKPFGHDLVSARALNAELHRLLGEDQILRIDHFLGKEPALDILFLRFGNSIFEPLWNRDRVQSVHITMAEDFGVADRGAFYDPVGALRDVVQNHLLQLIGLIAAEPPAGAGAGGLRDKRAEVFRAMPAADPDHYIRGQYDGYLAVPGVRPGSQTETFAALRLEIDNWRWAGVPFFIRAGKLLAEHVTEVRIIFKRPPRLAFAPAAAPDPDELILRIDPDPGIDLVVQAKQPGAQATRTVDLSLIFAAELGEAPLPYERLLGDALRGDSSLFTREDSVEETWRVVQPLLDAPPLPESYKPGSWGPASADKLLAGHPAWRRPWLLPPASSEPGVAGQVVQAGPRHRGPGKRNGQVGHGAPGEPGGEERGNRAPVGVQVIRRGEVRAQHPFQEREGPGEPDDRDELGELLLGQGGHHDRFAVRGGKVTGEAAGIVRHRTIRSARRAGQPRCTSRATWCQSTRSA